MDQSAENSPVASPAIGTSAEPATNESLNQVSESTTEGVQAVSVVAEKAAPKSLLETVKDALKATKTATEAKAQDGGEQSPGSEGEKDGAQQDEKQETDEQKDGDAKQGKGKGRDQRIKQLADERDSFKDRASQWDQLSAWARDSGLAADELSQSLAIAKMVKQSPHEALAALRGVVADLEKVTGYELPEDLTEKVERGLIDEETARELSVGRNQVARTEQQRRDDAAQRAAQADLTSRRDLAQSIGKAVTEFETSLESTDPDYQKIKGLVKSKVVELMHEDGVPVDANSAVAQVKKAVAEIKQQLSSVIPQRKATKQVPAGSTHGHSGARPQTSLEAARMALRGQAPNY